MRRIALTGALLLLSGTSWGQGVPNTPQVPGTLLSGPNAPEAGRTAVIAWHGDMLITFPEIPGGPPGDWLIRAWDISNPSAPIETQTLGQTRHGFMAHGFIKSGDKLNSGYTLEVDGNGVVSESANGLSFPWRGWGHSGMSRPWGVTDFWSYGDTNQPAEIYLDGRNGQPAAVFDPVGETGVIGHAFVLGTTLFYASDQSRTGIASWDVSDPSNPVLLDVLSEGSVGGYWPDPVGVNGRLYFFFPRNQPSGGYQIVDATDPTDLQLVADVPVDGNPNYAQFQDEFAFTERYKIDLRTFQIVLALDEEGDLRGGDPIDTSQFSLPIGNLVVTGGIYIGGTCSVPGQGTHCGTGMSIWAHQAEPDTRGPFVGYHAPVDGETNFPVTHSIQVLIHETLKSETINASTIRLRPVIGGTPGADVPADFFFASNDILSIVPENDLAENTTYEVRFEAGGIEDAVGNGMEPYSFRFSTGNGLAGGNQRPEIDAFSVSLNPIAPGASTGFSVSASDGDNDPLEYRFDFGDGQTTAWQGNSTANHGYDQAGHYTATVQVRDDAGALSTSTQTVTVVTPVSSSRGVHSGPLAMGGDRIVWQVNPDNDTVTRFDADSRARIDELRTCADPRSVSVDAQHRAWITCHDADQLLVIDADGRRSGVIDLGHGAAPFGVVYSPSLDRILVSLYGSGTVELYRPDTLARVASVAVGPTPRALAISANGQRALVTRFISPDSAGEVYDLDLTASAMAQRGVITLRTQWGEDDRADGWGLPNYLSAVAMAPDGDHAWVTGKKDNINRGEYHSGVSLDQDNTVRATLMKIDLASSEERFEQRSDLDNSEQPSAIDFSPAGDYAYIALQGNNSVTVVDTLKIDAGFTGASSVVSRITVGLAPQGVMVDADTQRLWVQNFMDRTSTLLDLAGFEAGNGPSFPAESLDRVQRERLDALVLRGKQVFYNASDPRMSGEGYMSCASCHIDGGHDGRSFDFTDRGEGVRNTTSLRGRSGMGHGLVHWSANFDEIQDFEHDIRGAFGGTGFLDDAQFASTDSPLGAPKAGMNSDLDALAAYVASLDRQSVPRSPHRTPDGALTAAAEAGQGVFNANGCQACHGGLDMTVSSAPNPDLRDLGSHGTDSGQRLGADLDGIDIPTLNGVWNTAPYLHNGVADSLEAVFDSTNGQTWQAESGTTTAQERDNRHWSLGGEAVVRNGAFLSFNEGQNVSLVVDGESGGAATLRLRYHANYGDADLTLTVGGAAQAVSAPMTDRDWRYRQWRFLDVPINLGPGPNTIGIRYDDGGGFALDELTLLDTAQARQAAEPHALVADLPAGERAQLIAYLEQLDARPSAGQTVSITAPSTAGELFGEVSLAGNHGAQGPARVEVAVNNGPYVPVSDTSNTRWNWNWDTGTLAGGLHVVTVRRIDVQTGTWVETQLQYGTNQELAPGGAMIFRSSFEP